MTKNQHLTNHWVFSPQFVSNDVFYYKNTQTQKIM